jgi:RecA-family ATPase
MTNDLKGKLVQCSSDVKPEQQEYLWKPFLAKGTFGLLAGEAGVGKTTIAIDLAARLTTNANWPDGTINIWTGGALLSASEDSFQKINKHRSHAAKVEHSKLYVVVSSFDPITQTESLIKELKVLVPERNIEFIIIDPLVDWVKGDLNKANDVRNSIRKLVSFAEEFDVAILGITHFAKVKEGVALIDRILGSQAFSAYARVVLIAAKDKNGDCYLGFAKNNYHRTDKVIKYSIEPCEVTYDGIEGSFETTKINWGDTHDYISISDILGGKKISKPEQDLRKKCQQLIEFIGSEKRRSTEVEKWFIPNLGGESTLKKVKKNARIKSARVDGVWYYLPYSETEGSADY